MFYGMVVKENNWISVLNFSKVAIVYKERKRMVKLNDDDGDSEEEG